MVPGNRAPKWHHEWLIGFLEIYIHQLRFIFYGLFLWKGGGSYVLTDIQA
jgi:hypothetical protein